jgi:hypothetical protein
VSRRDARKYLAPVTLWLLLLRAHRWKACQRSFYAKVVDEVGHESGPPRLVRSTTPTAIVTVKIFMEEYVVFEMCVRLELFIFSENRAPSVSTADKKLDGTTAQLIGDFVERQHDARAGWTLDRQPIAVKTMEPAQAWLTTRPDT